jgi:hypothetical protein
MINYNNGKIYKIEPICDHEENEIYIGSTTKQYLSQRFSTHRRCYKQWKEGKYHKFTVYDLFDKYGLENCQIFLLESVNVNSKDELLAREGHFIRTLKCVNRNVTGRTREETTLQYRQNNKDKISEYNKQYNQNNKDKINEYHKIYDKEYRGEKINCECGNIYTLGHRARHFKTIKHLNFIQNKIII